MAGSDRGGKTPTAWMGQHPVARRTAKGDTPRAIPGYRPPRRPGPLCIDGPDGEAGSPWILRRMETKSPPLTHHEIEDLLAEVARGSIQPRTAMALMVAKGHPHEDVTRLVFHALGGRDQTELDAQGRARYVGSGKLVADVERAIGDDLGA